MEESEKVPILLAEYNTLRAEVMAARSYIAQALGITAAVIIGVVGFGFSRSFTGPRWAPWAIAVIALSYLGGTFAWNEYNTRKFCTRLRELEADLNSRAAERLLIWETDSGWGSMVAHIHESLPLSKTLESLNSTRAKEEFMPENGTAGLRSIHVVGAVAAVAAVASFMISSISPAAQKLIVVTWIVLPPVYFFVELPWVRKYHRAQLEDCKMSQESASKIWAAVVAALILLYLQP